MKKTTTSIKKMFLLLLCSIMLFGSVAEASPKDLQNMTAKQISKSFKNAGLKVKSPKYGTCNADMLIINSLYSSATFHTGKKKNTIRVDVYEDSEDAINALTYWVWYYAMDDFYSFRKPAYELYRRGNVILTMRTTISKKTRNKYKAVIKEIYNK